MAGAAWHNASAEMTMTDPSGPHRHVTGRLSLSWTEGVHEEESQLLAATIDQALKWLYLRHPDALMDPPLRVLAYGNWVIPALAPDRPYWGTQWYVEASLDPDTKRVIAPAYLELVRREPWQRISPHLDLALLDQDLTDFPAPLARLRPDRYTLGTSFPGSMAVMSVYRVRALADSRVRDLALARLVRHHLGHVLGVPQFSRKEAVQRLGLESHCTRVCAMRHASSVEQLGMYALEEDELGWSFCETCTRGLHETIIRYQQSWN